MTTPSSRRTVLVTGAAGYIGSRLTAHLTRAGDVRVRALYREPVTYVAADEHVHLDLLGPKSDLLDALSGVDAVVHLAGANEVRAAAFPEEALTETIAATWRVASTAARLRVPRVVLLSTVHVYGVPADGQVLTEDDVPNPSSAYSIARLAGEHVCAAAGAETVVLRLTNSVGAPVHAAVPRWTLVANDLCRQAATTGRLRLHTNGLQWRDFVPMDEVCRIVAAAADPSHMPTGTYNVGTGLPTTVRELAELVQDVAGERTGTVPPLQASPSGDDPPKPHYVSVQRLADAGLRAADHLRTAIEETFDFCVANREALRHE